MSLDVTATDTVIGQKPHDPCDGEIPQYKLSEMFDRSIVKHSTLVGIGHQFQIFDPIVGRHT